MPQQSAWEKLTDGRCNWDLPDTARVKPLTARQIKEQAKLSMKSAQNKFKRANALNKLQDAGLIGAKEGRKLSDNWTKRQATNVTGFYDRKKARAIKRGEV